jgi:hypothetical protein
MNPAPSTTFVLRFPDAGSPERPGPPATPDAALHQWTACVVARELADVFEWDMHLPLAAAAEPPSVGFQDIPRKVYRKLQVVPD